LQEIIDIVEAWNSKNYEFVHCLWKHLRIFCIVRENTLRYNYSDPETSSGWHLGWGGRFLYCLWKYTEVQLFRSWNKPEINSAWHCSGWHLGWGGFFNVFNASTFSTSVLILTLTSAWPINWKSLPFNLKYKGQWCKRTETLFYLTDKAKYLD